MSSQFYTCAHFSSAIVQKAGVKSRRLKTSQNLLYALFVRNFRGIIESGTVYEARLKRHLRAKSFVVN